MSEELMVRKALVMLAVLAAFITCSGGQTISRTQAERIRRYEQSGSGGDAIMEATFDLTHHSDESADVLVRVCSKEPMPVALSIAAMSPFKVARCLRDVYNYSSERIVFLRSVDCLGSDPAVAATELWVVPRGVALPASVESLRSNEVWLEFLGREAEQATGTHNYRSAARGLIQKLRARPSATGIVLGYYYYRSPSPIMRSRLRNIRRLFEQSRLPRDRYFVRVTPWPGERSVDPPEQEPKYPSVFVVEQKRDSVRR